MKMYSPHLWPLSWEVAKDSWRLSLPQWLISSRPWSRPLGCTEAKKNTEEIEILHKATWMDGKKHGKPMENPWKNGKTMENPWKTMGLYYIILGIMK